MGPGSPKGAGENEYPIELVNEGEAQIRISKKRDCWVVKREQEKDVGGYIQ